MSKRVPKMIDPAALTVKCAEIEGSIHLEELSRLSQEGIRGNSGVSVNIKFNVVDGVRRPNFDILVEGRFSFDCERCGEEFEQVVSASSRVIVARSDEEAERFEEDYEVVILIDDEKLDVYQLVEDELLLAKPLVPKHLDEINCKLPMSYGKDVDTSEKRENPFAALAELKKH